MVIARVASKVHDMITQEGIKSDFTTLAQDFWETVLIPETKSLQVAVIQQLGKWHAENVNIQRSEAGIPDGDPAGSPGWVQVTHLDAAGASVPVGAAVERQIAHLRREQQIGGYAAAEEAALDWTECTPASLSSLESFLANLDKKGPGSTLH